MRGATSPRSKLTAFIVISTHTPHAGRDILPIREKLPISNFYSHAPCGARRTTDRLWDGIKLFLLTRPMRGATRDFADNWIAFQISTHTPHAGRDINSRCIIKRMSNFYSHAPCGARHEQNRAHAETNRNFYSHAPCGARQV